MKDLRNKRFGKLIVIESTEKYHGRYKWKCLCECGKEMVVLVSNLTSGATKDCGCQSRLNHALNTIIRRYKLQAKQRDLEWNLTKDEAAYLFTKRCFYCDAEPINIETSTKMKYNGIDRIDSSKGYCRSNCVACCVWCNRAKGDRTAAQFATWIENLYEFYFRDPS